jgi:hypothetical protein
MHHFAGAGVATQCGSGGSSSNLDVGGLSKMSQTVTVSYFSHSLLYGIGNNLNPDQSRCTNPDVNVCLFLKS